MQAASGKGLRLGLWGTTVSYLPLWSARVMDECWENKELQCVAKCVSNDDYTTCGGKPLFSFFGFTRKILSTFKQKK